MQTDDRFTLISFSFFCSKLSISLSTSLSVRDASTPAACRSVFACIQRRAYKHSISLRFWQGFHKKTVICSYNINFYSELPQLRHYACMRTAVIRTIASPRTSIPQDTWPRTNARQCPGGGRVSYLQNSNGNIKMYLSGIGVLTHARKYEPADTPSRCPKTAAGDLTMFYIFHFDYNSLFCSSENWPLTPFRS